MRNIDDLVERIELLKIAYFSGSDRIYDFMIGDINAADIQIMFEKGDISFLEDALHELRGVKYNLEHSRLSTLDSARALFDDYWGIKNTYIDNRNVFLTGEPVSEEMKVVLSKLKNGISVSSDDIERTPEIKLARTCVNNSIATVYLENRNDLQKNIYKKLMDRGSISGVDENGKVIYNGYIENHSRLDIVIGLPASGKSSAIVNSLSTEYKSRLIDNDEAKKEIPEFNDGWGGDIVHLESQIIERAMLISSFEKGNNIVYPKIGSDFRKLMKIVALAKEYGYKVNVHYVALDRNKALGRMLNRFIEEGRFLDPKLIDKYDNDRDGNKIGKVYNLLKVGGVIDGYSMWNNNVERGQKPIMIETNCEGRLFNNERYTEHDNIRHMGNGRGSSVQGGLLRDGTQERIRETIAGRKTEETNGGNVRRAVNTKKHKLI